MAHTSTFHFEKNSTTGFDRNDISAPKSIKEAEIMLEKTRIELTDIDEQLAIRKIDEAIDVFDDNEYLSLTWRRKALDAKRIKLKQIGLLKLWIKENSQLPNSNKEAKRRSQEESAKRQQENLRLKAEKLEVQKKQSERLRVETQEFGVVGKKVIRSLQREVKWLRHQLSITNAALITAIKKSKSTESLRLIQELQQMNVELLALDQQDAIEAELNSK